MNAAHAPGEQLEVGVPDPGHVAPVGDVVVEHAEQVVLAGLERERAQHLVGAGRVLDEQDPQLALRSVLVVGAAGRRRDRHGLGAPERGPRALEPGTMLASGTSSAVARAAAASAL